MQFTAVQPTHKIKHYHSRVILYSNELEHIDPALLNTHGVALVQWKEHLALYSKHQLMACRLTKLPVAAVVSDGLLRSLTAYLKSLVARKKHFDFVQRGEAYRLCHGDHDGLPGITIDHYGRVLVVQSSSAGSDLLMPDVIVALQSVFPDISIFEKSSGQMRQSEGLEPIVQWHHLPIETKQTAVLAGNQIQFDLMSGQKTGLFIDQRKNLEAFASSILPEMKTMLDICSYVGSWSVTAARQGIQSLTLLDQSQESLALAKENIVKYEPNAQITLCHQDMFEALKEFKHTETKFDIIVVDPPAFAKSKKHLREALLAYQRLFKLALSCLNSGGLFVACSCSRHVTEEMFLEVLQSVDKELICLYRGHSSPCHTQNLQVDFHDYLKCYVGF